MPSAPPSRWIRVGTILLAALFASCTVAPAPSVRPGPSGPPPSSASPAATLEVSPSGSLPTPSAALPTNGFPTDGVEWHALDCSGDDACRVTYVPEPAGDEPGWPVLLPGRCRGTAKSPGGVAYAACDSPDGMLVHAFDAGANAVVGWPLSLPGSTASVYENRFTVGCGDEGSSLAIKPNGTIVVAVADETVARLHVLTPVGRRVAGWPQPFPGDPPGVDGIGGNGCRGFAIGSDGRTLAWGYEGVEPAIELVAARTEFAMYGADGGVRPGWPRGSVGAASHAVILGDGSIAFASASGNAWRLLADGKNADGWPYELPLPVAPELAPGGRLVFLLPISDGQDHAIVLDLDGDVARGWPVPLGGEVETRCQMGDVPCAGLIRPAFGPDGTLYVALAEGSLTAIDPAGAVVRGWPVGLGEQTRTTHLAVDERGRLVADVTCEPSFELPTCEDPEHETLVFSPAGEFVGQR